MKSPGESTSSAFSGNWSAKFSTWGWRKECMRVLWQTELISIWENTSVFGSSDQGQNSSVKNWSWIYRAFQMEGDTPAWLGKNLFLWSVLDLLGCESSWVSGGCQDARGGAGCDSGHCSHLTATLRSCLGPPNYARAFPLLLGNSSGVPAQPAQPAQRVWGQAGLHSLQEGSCRARIPDFYPGTVWEWCQGWAALSACGSRPQIFILAQFGNGASSGSALELRSSGFSGEFEGISWLQGSAGLL